MAPFELRLRAGAPARGVFEVPGDKSIAHRAAVFGALAAGRTTVRNWPAGEDCASTLRCVEALGARVERDGDLVEIEGRGEQAFVEPAFSLDAGNSGTTMRLLAGALAGRDGEFKIAGDASLSRRPMERVARPLRAMGARVETDDGRPPLRIAGRSSLAAIDWTPERPSAQVKSAILLAGLAAGGRTSVAESVRTRDHTERMLVRFGARAGRDGDRVWVEGPCALRASTIDVPGDFSSAAFPIALALLVPGSDVVVCGVGLNPTRTRFLDALAGWGANVGVIPSTERSGGEDESEPRGDVRAVYGGRLEIPGGHLIVDARAVAEAIDEIPILAVLAATAAGTVVFEGVEELRAKECDRVAAVVDNLARMGGDARADGDRLEIRGVRELRGARVSSFGDHRVAMAFACAALAARGETILEDPGAARISFPEFFDRLPEGSVVAESPRG